MAVSIEFAITNYMCVFVTSMASVGLSSLYFEVAVIRDLKNNLNSIDESSKSPKGRFNIFKKLSHFIEIHSMMKKLRKFET